MNEKNNNKYCYIYVIVIFYIRTLSTVSTVDSRKKSKSAPIDKKKSSYNKRKKMSQASVKASDTCTSVEHSVLKYILNFGEITVYLFYIFSHH